MSLEQPQTRIVRSGRTRRLDQMLDGERFMVTCAKCLKSASYDRADLRHFPQEVALSHFEESMPPKCWGMWDRQPADCPREVTWLDVSPEDAGVSDEG